MHFKVNQPAYLKFTKFFYSIGYSESHQFEIYFFGMNKIFQLNFKKKKPFKNLRVTRVLYLKTTILVIVNVEKTSQASVIDGLVRFNINGALVHAQCGRVLFRPRLRTLHIDAYLNMFR
jgi:hypothetical protein